MRASLPVLLALTLAVAACSTVRESRLNPLNWFGRSEARAIETAQRFEVQTDSRPLVDQVTAMEIERIPGGAILRATGLPPAQGFYDAELVQARGTADRPLPAGTLVYDFRLLPPPYRTQQGTEFSRTIDAAVYLTDNDLAGAGTIVVRGLRTERVLRR